MPNFLHIGERAAFRSSSFWNQLQTKLGSLFNRKPLATRPRLRHRLPSEIQQIQNLESRVLLSSVTLVNGVHLISNTRPDPSAPIDVAHIIAETTNPAGLLTRLDGTPEMLSLFSLDTVTTAEGTIYPLIFTPPASLDDYPEIFTIRVEVYHPSSPETTEAFADFSLKFTDLSPERASLINNVLNLQLSGDDKIDGAFRTGIENTLGSNGTRITPYFNHFAGLALLDAYAETGEVQYRDAVERMLQWSVKRTGEAVDGNGKITVPKTLANGTTVQLNLFDRRLFIDLNDEDDEIDQYVVADPDAVDSAAAMYLLVLSRFEDAGGTVTAEMEAAARECLSELNGLKHDGLTYALHLPSAENPSAIKYLGDNIEVASALHEVAGKFINWGDSSDVILAQSLAQEVTAGLEKFQNPNADWLFFALDNNDKPQGDFRLGYPDAWVSLFLIRDASFLVDKALLWQMVESNFDPESSSASSSALEYWTLAAWELDDSAPFEHYQELLRAEASDWTASNQLLPRHALAFIALGQTWGVGNDLLPDVPDPGGIGPIGPGTGATGINSMIASRSNGNWWIAESNGTGFTNQHWGSWSNNAQWVDVTEGDFNGDGRTDIAGRTNGNWWVSLATVKLNQQNMLVLDGFSTTLWGKWSKTAQWTDVVNGDFNGDGRTDIAGRSNGNWWVAFSMTKTEDNVTIQYFETQKIGKWSTTATWMDVLAADFNGDGRTDLAGRSNRNWWVSLSEGDSLTTTKWAFWSNTVTWTDVQSVDVNGDGKIDILGQTNNGHWWVAVSNGNSFESQHWAFWSDYGNWQDLRTGDFNGDGMTDLAGRKNGNWWVGLSNGTRFVAQLFGNWSQTANWVDVFVGDFNGDGRDDIVGRSNGNWWVALSDASSFTTQLWGSAVTSQPFSSIAIFQ